MKNYFLILTIIILNIISKPINAEQVSIIFQELSDTKFQIQDSTIKKVAEIDLKTSTSLKPLISDNQIYSCTDDGLIYCYDLKGNEKWVTDITGNISSNLVHFKDLILLATKQGDLYSINANNGDVVQVMGVGEKITTDLLLINFTDGKVLSKAVVFGTEKGNVFCYEIFSFELIWKNRLSQLPLVANPLHYQDKIFIKDNSSTIFCLNSISGILIWKYDQISKENLQAGVNILSDGKSVFYLNPNNEIISIDLMLGKKVWGTKPLDIVPQIYLNFTNQYLILLSKKGELIFIAAKDGKESSKTLLNTQKIETFNCANSPAFTLLLTSGGNVYRINDNNSLSELVNFNYDSIVSINVISEKQFLVSNNQGKIIIFKFD